MKGVGKRLFSIILGLLIIAGSWYYFYYRNALTKMDRLRREISGLYRYKGKLPLLMANYEKAERELKVYSRQLPLKQEIPSLLVKLSRIIKSEDVVLLSFNPKPAKRAKRGLYYIKPIVIKLRSTYLNCGRVFEKVSKMKRLFKIKDFSLSDPKIVNAHKVLVDVTFSAETYYFKGKKLEK